eukprot:6631628-Alexandrium_andersonii.AAC.1
MSPRTLPGRSQAQLVLWAKWPSPWPGNRKDQSPTLQRLRPKIRRQLDWSAPEIDDTCRHRVDIDRNLAEADQTFTNIHLGAGGF